MSLFPQLAKLFDEFVSCHNPVSGSVGLSVYDSDIRVMATPYVTIIRNVVASTQDLAAEEVANSGGPALVIAHEQTTGRGRSGNVWWQATRGIAASLAFAPGPVADTFTLGVGLAVRQAIQEVAAIETDLKWPNDIEFHGGKVGGILVERRNDLVVAGCGLNLYWSDPPEGASGLLDVDPGPELGEEISRRWADSVFATRGAWDRDAYIAACSTIGQTITWQGGGPGKALTVDDSGGLVVMSDTSPMTLRSGVVQTVRGVSDDA